MSRFTSCAVPAAVALGVTFLSGATLAGERRTHDGFFLRLAMGVGGASTQIEVDGTDYTLRSGGDLNIGDGNIAIGAVVIPNLIIHGTFFGWDIGDPEYAIEGIGSAEAGGSVGVSAFGGGLTYYFMPANIYLSGSLGAGTLEIEDGDVLQGGESGTGLLGEITLGKEWWVGGSWGLGVAGAFGFHSVPNGGVLDENWSGTNWGIRFSATLN